jgi:hypothetical protein
MATSKYKVITGTNFSIGKQEFYLSPGQEVELPSHALVESMVKRGHLAPKKEYKSAAQVAPVEQKKNEKNK